MARVLIVGCGCRGRELAGALMERGHVVRGSSRDAGRRAQLEAIGAEAVDADPDRLGTLVPHLAGVSVLVWLLGLVDSGPLHAHRLDAIFQELVDTHVRGVVYERAHGGEHIARRAAQLHHMPVEIVEPGDDLAAAVELVLSA